MMKIYVDSSAYVKFFKSEVGSSVVKKIIDLAEKDKITICISMWTINESIAAIDKKHYQKHLIKEKTKNKIIATILQETLKFGKSRNIRILATSNGSRCRYFINLLL